MLTAFRFQSDVSLPSLHRLEAAPLKIAETCCAPNETRPPHRRSRPEHHPSVSAVFEAPCVELTEADTGNIFITSQSRMDAALRVYGFEAALYYAGFSGFGGGRLAL